MKNIFTKTFLLLAFLGLTINTTKAQYVTIPDANFAAWLNLNYPSCMNGNLMDTTCAGIINATNLVFGNSGIANLSGIEYFINLSYLDCQYNFLTDLPILPNSLDTLNCQGNLLTSLSNLPNSVVDLNCSVNLLTSLPTLPNSLIKINCSTNQLMDLPILPNSLKVLGCSYNSISVLPALPNLHSISCHNNQIVSLPILPNSLTGLSCGNNLLTSLPILPDTMIAIYCEYNQLNALPVLPNSVVILYCGNNQLSNLPILPDSLLLMRCESNQLINLPSLPNTLVEFNCSNNLISCFPTFPDWTQNSMISFDISNNPFNCLPNYIPIMDSLTLLFSLCNSINTNGCPSASGILGKVYNENINNCILDTNDIMLPNIKVNFFNPINSIFGLTYTLPNGVFNFPSNTGTQMVIVDTLNKPYQANCSYPGIDSTIVTTVSNPLASNVNFDIKCKPGLDLNVQSVNHKDGLIFPGQQHTLQVMVGDASQWYGLNCANGNGGQVQITINGPVTYNGPAPGALTPTVNGNVYTYTIADFGTIDNATDFQMLFTTDTTAQSGNQVCVHTEVTPIVGDVNPSNNINDYCYIVHNSYDPNYKEVYPTDVPPLFQDWLTYTIHFQNLGTAPAINIRLLDTLDNNLDAETFEVINYSHYNTVTLMDGILDFRFPNILLPDSASNPNGSQGFVQYRIKPIANLPVGTQIENTAHIYFDFNPAVVTNTTVNNFTTTVGNTTLPQASRLWLYPNPSTGIFTISAKANIEVYNIVGDLILSENNVISIDLTAAPKGMYFVKLNGDKIEKLIKN
jgi:uncharacterized repeat protein (TIGR01451 family)